MPREGSARSAGLRGRRGWLWLGGALVLVIIGGGLAYFRSPGRGENARARIEVALPPLASKAALLAPAPDPGLIENTRDGSLPIIGKDGRQAWQVYARPFDQSDKRPRIALIVTGLGLDAALSQAALDRLPGAVTFGFAAYASDLKAAMTRARNLGHETFIGMPMEPLDYPRQDPGPLTLLTSLDQAQNIARLDKLMSAGVGYVGMVAIMGSRFETEKISLVPVLENLRQRGLMFVDDRAPAQSNAAPLAAQMKLPWAAADRAIDIETAPAAIDQALADLETAARRNGAALGIAALSPALLDRAGAWLATLDGKGLALAPASAIANRQTPAPAPGPQ